MIPFRISLKFLDNLLIFLFFFTPLLFFIHSHDQFELPKLTFLMVLLLPAAILALKNNPFSPPTFLSMALYLLAFIQILASLPSTSLSWSTSCLGDYENFAGLTTLFTYLGLFQILSLFITEVKIEKIFYFNSLAALFSSFYAIGQHFGFDFIQWNPESVNSAREFAALGNPNFLSAYLAMSIPLFLSLATNIQSLEPKRSSFHLIPFWFFSVLGFFLLFLSTDQGLAMLQLIPMDNYTFFFRIMGLVLCSIGFVRLFLIRHWITNLCVLTILSLGLFCTGSRGGFLGALFGIGVWLILVFKKKEFSDPLRQKIKMLPMIYLVFSLLVASGFLFLIGHGFLIRLADSVIHMGKSLATSRLHIWRPAIRIIESNPLLGVGLDNFKIAFPYYSGIEFNEIDGMFMSSRMAHNELLQMASTTGLLGLFAYLGVLAAFVFLWWRSYKNSNPTLQWCLMGVLSSAVAYQIQNLFSFGVASINLIWFLLLAIVQNLYRKTLTVPHSNRLGFNLYNLVKKVGLFFFICICLIFPLRRLGADIAFGQGNAASQILKNSDSQIAIPDLISYSDFEINHLKRATELCPLEVKYRLYLGLAYEQRGQINGEKSQDWNLLALNCYKKSIEMSPSNAYYYNNEGRIEDLLSRIEPQFLPQAEQAYQKSVLLDPSSPYFIINWANDLDSLGKTNQSEKVLQRAFQLDPSFSSKILSQMAFEQYKMGNKQKAFHFLDEGIKGNTSSAEAYYCRGIINLSEKNKKQALKDFETVQSFHPTPQKNPSIQSLDQFIIQSQE